MLKIIMLGIIQAAFLSAGQVFLKIAMNRMETFSFAWKWFASLLTNWWLGAMGACFTIAGLLWLYMLKNFQFSVAYPVTSIAYIFGMLAAILVFHETVPLTRWLGVMLIMAGVILIAK
ncbi:MAG: EamA family transporter [Bacteroidales bacterium]|jgi:undecaprenyl phosphate-alpha-L-ara4N flippase subunit ArnE|nr:EamA family transporter [Bacteroidales bacterium]